MSEEMTELECLRRNLRQEVDHRTDRILSSGMFWQGSRWSADKIHFDDYRDACQQIMTGLASEILIHGIGQDAYVMLNASNVQEFFELGKKFKLDTMFDGYRIKDLGGTLSSGLEIKPLKEMSIEELREWRDPRN